MVSAQPQSRGVGGRFAPPLTDAILASYKTTIDALPDTSPYKSALLACWKCCDAWWHLPEPAGTKVWDHPTGVGQIVAMQDDHKEALWDLIPWDHELDALCGAPDGKIGLFDRIDEEANHRNGERRREWNLAVYRREIESHYPDDPAAYDKVWDSIRCEDKWLPFVSETEKKAHADRKAHAEACCAAIVKSVNAREHPDVPQPAFEPTPLRHVATHLIWHVRELNLDREPCTADKLKV